MKLIRKILEVHLVHLQRELPLGRRLGREPSEGLNDIQQCLREDRRNRRLSSLLAVKSESELDMAPNSRVGEDQDVSWQSGRSKRRDQLSHRRLVGVARLRRTVRVSMPLADVA